MASGVINTVGDTLDLFQGGDAKWDYREDYPEGAAPNGSDFTYDDLSRISTITDALTHVTSFSYWADGRPKDTTNGY